MSSFGIIVLSPTIPSKHQLLHEDPCALSEAEELSQYAVALAAARSGNTGVLNLLMHDLDNGTVFGAVQAALKQLGEIRGGSFGIKINLTQLRRAEQLLKHVGRSACVIVAPAASSTQANLKLAVDRIKKLKHEPVVEVTSIAEARIAAELGAAAVVAKGHEAAGRVGDTTTFVLLQQCMRELTIPVWAEGGIGLHTAAACRVAGAGGVVLESQLLLCRESDLTFEMRQKIAAMDGTETTLVRSGDHQYRIYARAGHAVLAEAELNENHKRIEDVVAPWWQKNETERVWFLGQDVSFAADLAERFHCVAGVAQAIKECCEEHVAQAAALEPLKKHSPLAQSHGTDYPIVQGAMTRVSDTAQFAKRVAEGGGLPFLALALMRGGEVEKLIKETSQAMGDMPWGAGLLGFVPQELRQEQLEVITRYKPPYALIAGGRPDQARALEELGIKTYLHVPSPLLLASFIEMGSRRFIFEGRECGGHVGPRSSFVLWETMVETLLNCLGPRDDASQFHILFAGGIHDALSAAMVQTLAAPLAQRGMKFGVLLGTAYLFTSEAVEAGAIVPRFQKAALEAEDTVLLETGPGHAIRCINSPYKRTFDDRRQELILAKKSRDEIREHLEFMNLGRLRIASKGLTRAGDTSTPGDREEMIAQSKSASRLVQVPEKEQWSNGMYMIGQVAAMHSKVVSIRQLHEDVSTAGTKILATMTGAMAITSVSEAASETSAVVAPSAPIAIVGMSCMFPKAQDLESYWQNILDKVDTITEVPETHWDWRNYYDTDPLKRDRVVSKWGGFLEDVTFEPTKYGIPPSSLASIDPMQILLLEITEAVLADAGYDSRPFPRQRTSVLLANAGHGPITALYSLRSMLGWKLHGLSDQLKNELADLLPEWTEDSFPGYLGNVAAGRIANRFDLGGINFSIDAACGSSLAALHTAVAELRNHNSDVVLLGAADTHNQPGDYLSFSKTHAFSPGGKCRTFDATADGIVISEGIAMVMLKRLDDAQRDGDKIYAVIRGIGGSSDGRDLSLTAPRPAGQVLAVSRAYADAQISASTVTLVEAHGTGTVAGDKAEIEALKQVFEGDGAQKRACAVGSVKTMIGHTKAAAGLASLIKVAKALHHKVLPPTMGVQVPNPACDFENSPFYVNSETRPWIHSGPTGSTTEAAHPRRAGVSAFGFGGTNFHAVLEEHVAPGVVQTAPSAVLPSELFVLRASSRQELIRQASSLAESARRTDGTASCQNNALAALSLQTHLRQVDAHRAASANLASADTLDAEKYTLAIVTASAEDLLSKLEKALSHLKAESARELRDPRGLYVTQMPGGNKPKVAFIFPGQGSQQVNMLRELSISLPVVRQTCEEADLVLKNAYPRRLSCYIYPQPSFSRQEEERNSKELTNTHVAQPAVGCADIAAYRALLQLGVKPDMVAGHSYGELVALCAAGALAFADLMRISEVRGRLFAQADLAKPGTMAALSAEKGQVEKLLGLVAGVTIANVNAPNQCVISGDTAAIEEALAICKKAGLAAKTIPVSQAFHSPHMKHAQAPLQEALESTDIEAPRLPVYSNVGAEIYTAEKNATVARLTEHIIKPVDFVRQIEKMYDDGARIFVEVGPGSVLTNLVSSILAQKEHLVVSLDRSGRNSITQFQHAAAQLAAQGVNVDTSIFFRGRAAQIASRDAAMAKTRRGAAAPARLTYRVNSSRIERVLPERSATDKKEGPVTARNPVGMDTQRKDKEALPAPQASFQPEPRQPQHPQQPLPAAAPQQPPQPGASPSVPLPQTFHPQQPGRSAQPDRALEQIMLQYQQTMLQMTNNFIEAQQQVMLAYLAGRNGQPMPMAPMQLPQMQLPVPGLPAKSMQTAPLGNQPQAWTGNPQFPPAPVTEPSASLSTTEQPSQSEPALLRTIESTVAGISAASTRLEGSPSSTLQHEVATSSLPASRSNGQDTVSADELINTLLDIVSQRTGYPPEMLDPSLDLEADLGIDSIKRVEILNSFRKVLPEAKQQQLEGGIEQLAGTKTLQGIIDWIRTEITAPADSAAPSPAISERLTAQQAPANGGHDGNGHDGNGHGDGRGVDRQLTRSLNEIVQPEVVTPVTRGLVELTPLPAVTVEIATLKGPSLIIDDETGFGAELSKQLAKAGSTAVIVRHRAGQESRADDGVFYLDLTDERAVSSLLSAFAKNKGEQIYYLLALKDCVTHTTPAAWDRDSTGTIGLFCLARQMAAVLPGTATTSAKLSLLAATAMGGTFGFESSHSFEPSHGAIAGLMKCLSREWPSIICKCVDFEATEKTSAVARRLIEETLAAPEYLLAAKKHAHHDGNGNGHQTLADSQFAAIYRRVEIGYRAGTRVGLDVSPAPLPEQSTGHETLDSSDIVLVTGGARGITAEIALELARLYKPTLLIVGRSPRPCQDEDATTVGIESQKDLKAAIIESLREGGEKVSIAAVESRYQKLMRDREIRRTLAALEQLGARVEYYHLDVRDEAALSALLDEIYRKYGTIDGVIHGAGVIEDAYVKDKSVESFRRVYETKVLSARTLAERLRLDELKFIYLFSSVVGRTGNAGQTDYVAANEVMNKLATNLNQKMAGRAASILWGPWRGGMAQPELESIFARYGWAMIDRPAGRASFIQELTAGGKQNSEVLLVAEAASAEHCGQARGARLQGSTMRVLSSGNFEFDLTLDTATDLYLNDHTFDGVPVMPMAMSLELMTEAVTSAYPDLIVTSVKQFDIPSGIVFESGRKQVFIRVFEEPANGADVTVRAELSAAPGKRSNFKAIFHLNRLPENSSPQADLHLPSRVVPGHSRALGPLLDAHLERDDSQPLPGKTDVYGKILFHGPLFQGITGLRALGKDGVSGDLKASSPLKCLSFAGEDRWVVDPILFDSAMQLAGVWARRHLDITVLPTGFKGLHLRHDALVKGDSFAARVFVVPGANVRELTCDVCVYNSEGELAMVIEGLGGVGSRSLNRLAAQSDTLGTPR